MQSNNGSTCGSSSSGSVVNVKTNLPPALTVVKSNKAFRNIVINENSVNEQKLQNQRHHQQIKLNEAEQQRLDLDVILSGFPLKPDCKAVVQSFLDVYQIPIGKVKTSFQFENNATYKTFHHIVITFVDKASKSQLFATHIKLGRPRIRWNQVSGNNRIDNNPLIKFQSRFSRFNFWAEKQLYRLKVNGIISEYKFCNVFYGYKQTPTSQWQDVSIEADLDDLIDLLRNVR